MRRHTWLELNTDRLAANVRAVRAALPERSEILFVVKANAYGHGLVPVARCAWAAGVRRFAVAHLAEALDLRVALPAADILVLGVLDPADAREAAQQRIAAVVVSPAHGAALSRAVETTGPPLSVHAKVDTGMGRIGLDWETAPEAVRDIATRPGLRLVGLCSHLATAGGSDREFAEEQARRFRRVVETCEARGLDVGCRHLANSGGVLTDPAWDWDAVRPGILLYGYPPPVAARRPISVQPCLSWRTRVVQVKDLPAGRSVSYDRTWVAPRPTRLATLDIGYADGFSRALSNRGQVLLRGRRCPVVGRVTMNLTMVDVGPSSDVSEGDVATLLGADGAEALWADELAGWSGTIPYEVLTGLRVDDRRTVASTIPAPPQGSARPLSNGADG